MRAEGFEPSTYGLKVRHRSDVTSCRVKPSDDADSVLALCLATIRETCPSLAYVVDAWADLSEPIRAAIRALVNSAMEGQQ